MKKLWIAILFASVAAVGCGSSSDGSGGSGGTAGSGGSAGTGGTAGSGGEAGMGGEAGSGGEAGMGGSAGEGGSAGMGGMAGDVLYEQDFDQLDITGGVVGDDWFFVNNVFDAADTLLFSYNNPPQLAPNATINPDNIFISALVDDQGGPEQGAQQLSVFSDYKCCQPDNGHLNGTDKVEVNVLRDVFTAASPIAADDIGTTVTFAFQAKRGNIEAPTTALGYIKTLDPAANFAQTNFVVAETTNIGTEWTPLTVSLSLADAALEGQVLQIGFQNTASDFDGSGVFYDNVVVTQLPAAP